MKKLYFIASMILASLSSFAQSDLQILHNVQTGDTLKYNPTNPVNYAFAFGFVNHGPAPLVQSDTIFLKTMYTQGYFVLTLPAGGVPVSDTVYFADTIYFTAGPASGPMQWCDSIWAKHAGGVTVVDTNLSNNKVCNTIYFLNQSLSVSENINSSKVAGGIGRLDIYPNPAVSSMSFEYNATVTSKAYVTVTDITGRKVYQKDLGEVYGAKKVTIETDMLNSGMYIVELRVGNAKQIGKVLIQK